MDESCVDNIFAALRAIQSQLREVDDNLSEYDITAFVNIITTVQMQLDKLQRARRVRRASTDEMTAFIVAEIIHPKEEKKTMKQSLLLPGGLEAKVRARAQGKCELCDAEFRLGVHHIVARAKGGLDHEDNLALLCHSCHNEVEEENFISRASLLRRKGSTPIDPEIAKARAEKAAATRASNLAAQSRANAELEAWDEWSDMTSATVPYLTLEEVAEVERPEKYWHVFVYGAGRHARIAPEKE
jgi:hypothetical protein